MNALELFAQATYTQSQTTMSPGTTITFIIFMLFITLLAYVINAYLYGRIFKKAGIEAWRAWIPVYSTYIIYKMGDQRALLWTLLSIVPIANIVAAIFQYVALHRIGLKLGKSDLFVLLAIFVPIVWLIWLAFDASTWKQYIDEQAAPAPLAEAPKTDFGQNRPLDPPQSRL